MAITVFLNEVRAGTAETDRLVVYQPSADASLDIESYIDLVVAVKGRYNEEPSGKSSNGRFNKFMLHLSFGRSDKVPLPGFESNQGTLESLRIMVEKAKAEGLTDMHTFISCVETPKCKEERLSRNRFQRLMQLLDDLEDFTDSVGGTYEIISHSRETLKIELRADKQFSSFDGVNTEQDGSLADGLPLATYQSLVSILRFPERTALSHLG